MNDTRSAGASWRRSPRACAPFALAALLALASAPASATIIRGYTDLYVTDMRDGFYQYGDDSQWYTSAPCQFAASGPCAKTRFSFEYDTSKPPYEMRTRLELVQRYYRMPPAESDVSTNVIDGKEYLGLSYLYSYRPHQQLGPTFVPGDDHVPDEGIPPEQIASAYRLTKFAVGLPGNAFNLEFAADRWINWGHRYETCAADYEFYSECRNTQGQRPGDEGAIGPFFSRGQSSTTVQEFAIANVGESFHRSTNDQVSWWARWPLIGTVRYAEYAFDNSPKNWVDGAPEARIWIVEAPEPATLSLLAVGLAALAGMARRRRLGGADDGAPAAGGGRSAMSQ